MGDKMNQEGFSRDGLVNFGQKKFTDEACALIQPEPNGSEEISNRGNPSGKIEKILAARDHRILELEQALEEAQEMTRAKIQMLREIRLDFEEAAANVARIQALEKNARDLHYTRMQELLEIMEGVEAGVEKIYRTRRWRFANIVFWVKGFFHARNKRPFRRYWRIDTKLAEFHAWRERYFRSKF